MVITNVQIFFYLFDSHYKQTLTDTLLGLMYLMIKVTVTALNWYY